MDILDFREFCLSLPYSTECTPFDETSLVFKVGGKMFALCDMDNFTRVAVKCDPTLAIELREKYPEVTPAYHFNKKHWNDISVIGDLPEETIKEWVRDSYDLVFKSLPAKIKEEFK